ncbi:pyridoxal phosphate-dependent aminotransferase [Sulfitobacter pacificus]|jgi:aspartate aminotransferase|uniref:Aminotransferase n=2 Tax=Sulfitobacter pacificus TaxID=1499314 RepID=A0ABQ5VPH9_9RHOB|nr:pyridoxal phosphate-dependent aminotransferase [Sulfitobacter pacificus]GLQ29055.1 aminotransferase [Sulfitobacter pacificus]
MTAPAVFKPSSALSKVGPSAISRMMAATAEMKRQGRDVIGLHVGEPDFNTPENILDAANRAMRNGETHYSALDGSPAVKAAVLEKFRRENGLNFTADEVVVTTGAKMMIFSAFMASIGPGDEVILPAPYWVSYSDIVEMMGATPVILPTKAEDGFVLKAADLEAAITPNTRWILINSPSNPTGTIYSAEDYAPLLDVLAENPHVWLMVDDMYEHLIFDPGTFVTPAQLRPDLRDRILTVNGVSKAYAMTGWRIGYGAGPLPLMKAIRAVVSQSTSCTCTIAQAAAVEALTGPQEAVSAYLAEYRSRRSLIMEELHTIPGLVCAAPAGTFYAFVDWRALVGSITPGGEVLADDETFCHYMLQEHGVAVVPGAAFGAAGYFRISFASDEQSLRQGMARIRLGCAALTR